MSIQGVRMSAPRFAGEREYQQYLATFQDYDYKSISRLAAVKRNEKNEGIKHISMAIGLGAIDSRIRALNTEIIRLIKGKRKQDPVATEHLGDLRRAIETTLVENGYDTSGNRLNHHG